MKKLFGIVALAACLSLVGGGEARAAGPYYVYFADYCDCITLERSVVAGHPWYVGTWDWECSGGVSSTLIHGIVTDDSELILGTRPIDSTGAPAGFSATLAMESSGLGSDHAHVTATFDGLTTTLVAEETDYFLRTGPACPGPPNSKPRLFP